MILVTKKPRIEQYRLNVMYLLAGYENGMNDCGEEQFPRMTFNEVVQYVNFQVYHFIYDGNGGVFYNKVFEKWAQELKFIKKIDKLAIIKEIAMECNILAEEQ